MTPFKYAGDTITNCPDGWPLQTYYYIEADAEVDSEVYEEVRFTILRKLEDWLYSYDIH